MQDKLLSECVRYFKSDNGFKRLMTEIKNKYKSIGSLGGTVCLSDITPSEKEALTSLMGQKFYFNKKSTIYVKDVVNSLKNTKFENVNFYEMMCLYFNEQIIQDKELRDNCRVQKERFFDSLSVEISDNIYKYVMNSVNSKTGGIYTLINSKYNEDGEGLLLKKELIYLDNIISVIDKNKKIRLAIVSANITSDPHYIDEGTYLNKLLTYYLCAINNIKFPSNAEEKNYLFYDSGILKDDISNNTLIAGISGFFDKNLEYEHAGWRELSNAYEPYVMSMYNISKLESLKAEKNKVIILENPTVFMKIHEILSDEHMKYGLVCSNGQVNTSTLLILDMLYNSGCKFYYSGDFDPEGLVILNKLLIRYKESIEPLFYSIEDYKQTMSENVIDDKRLKQLDRINDHRLLEIIDYMKNVKRAGYQEKLELANFMHINFN